MKIEKLIKELYTISEKLDTSNNGTRINMISELTDKLRGKPIVTEIGDWVSDGIVESLNKLLDNVAISDREAFHEIEDMIVQLRTWR